METLSTNSLQKIAICGGTDDAINSRFGESVSYNTACATTPMIPELIDSYNDYNSRRSER
jgi:hypothetical protein